MRSRVNDMISTTQRMAYTRRSNGQAFKPGTLASLIATVVKDRDRLRVDCLELK